MLKRFYLFWALSLLIYPTCIWSADVSFSHLSGFYNEPFELDLATSNDSFVIFYTLNGDTPTDSSIRYDKPFLISDTLSKSHYWQIRTNPDNEKNYPWQMPSTEPFKGIVIRAALFKDSVRVSAVITKTFFISDISRYSFPVVSLVTDSVNLFGYDEGIYVPGVFYDKKPTGWHPGNYYQEGDEWERPAHVEFFNKDGKIVVSEDCGVKIHGSGSSFMPAKSLRLTARAKYGSTSFKYRFFEDKPYSEFNSLILRASGQDFPKTLIADAFMQSLVKNFDLEYQSSKPHILFINGEYWGIHTLSERYDKHYLDNYHKLSKDSIDLLAYEMGITIEEGDTSEYNRLMSFVDTADMTNFLNYQKLCEQISIQNFIDYHVVKLYYGVSDWPGNNLKMWRPRKADGRWRWLNYDNDDGFRDAELNTIDLMLNYENYTGYPNPNWSTLLFRKAVTNSFFKEEFGRKFIKSLNTTFNPDTVNQVLLKFRRLYKSEIGEHIERWSYPQSVNFWNDEIDNYLVFAEKRSGNIKKFLMDELEIDTNSTGQIKPKERAISGGPQITFDNNKKSLVLHSFTNVKNSKVSLYDVNGRKINCLLTQSEKNTVLLHSNRISSGIHFVEIIDGDVKLVRKMMITR